MYGFFSDHNQPPWHWLTSASSNMHPRCYFSLIRNLAFHNLLTDLPLPLGTWLLLGLSHKFYIERSLPYPDWSKTFRKILRSIWLRHYHMEKGNKLSTEYNPKLYVNSTWNPPFVPPPSNVELRVMKFADYLEDTCSRRFWGLSPSLSGDKRPLVHNRCRSPGLFKILSSERWVESVGRQRQSVLLLAFPQFVFILQRLGDWHPAKEWPGAECILDASRNLVWGDKVMPQEIPDQVKALLVAAATNFLLCLVLWWYCRSATSMSPLAFYPPTWWWLSGGWCLHPAHKGLLLC